MFENVATPLTNKHDRSTRSIGGQIGNVGNMCYPGCTHSILDQAGKALAFMPSDFYANLADSTDSALVIVWTAAGPGTIKTPNGAPTNDRIMMIDPILLSGTVES